MQADFSQKLKRVLSNERLAGYQQQLSGNGNRNLFSHYAWNIAVSESLYSSLQLLEIGLRNTLHQAAAAHFGKVDWFLDNSIIQTRDQLTVDKAKQMLRRKKKKLEPGRIIAELNFGFWTSLFDKRYEQTLWPFLIKASFPHMPKTIRTRKNLSKRFNKIRLLRNRIFHHEPIWYWQDLAQQHDAILNELGWIDPALQDLAGAIDHFPDVYQNGLNDIQIKMKQFC